MNKPPFFPIATSAPTLELHDERVDLPTNRAPTLEPHDEEVELPTSTTEAQVVEGPVFLKVQGVIVEVENKSKQPSSSNENLDSSSTSNGGVSIGSGEDDGPVTSPLSETKNLGANNNLDRNVRWHNQRMLEGNKKKETDHGPKDDVTGASVTANNAGARLSSLEHCPNASFTKKNDESQSNNSDDGHTTTIKIKWPIEYFGICFLTVFTIVWNGVIFITFDALGLVALFIPHTWVGIYLIHFMLCLLFNSTIITITSSTVNVRVTPFSAGNPSKSYALDDETVKGIRCKRGTFDEDSYEVHIAREDGSSDKVLAGLKYVAEAQFVAQEIERIMSIRDNEKTYVV